MLFKQSPKELFEYQFKAEKNKMNQCSGILTYQSALIYSTDEVLLQRIQSVSVITDIKPANYKLLVQGS